MKFCVSLNLLILTKSGWPLGLRMAILHFTDLLMCFNNNMIILCIIDSCHVVFQITT